jgi:3-methyladenine DNA glycosylase Tag
LIAITSETAARPAPFEPLKIVNQDQNTRQDVLQSNEIIRHGPRGLKWKCRIPPALNVKKKQEFA